MRRLQPLEVQRVQRPQCRGLCADSALGNDRIVGAPAVRARSAETPLDQPVAPVIGTWIAQRTEHAFEQSRKCVLKHFILVKVL